MEVATASYYSEYCNAKPYIVLLQACMYELSLLMHYSNFNFLSKMYENPEDMCFQAVPIHMTTT